MTADAAAADRALADSRELARRIADEIDAAGGWIGFDRYMQRALYEPGIGYYSGPNRVFGAEGDFVTAPEMSSLFGGCVAAQCAQWLHADGEIVEFGAGFAMGINLTIARLGSVAADNSPNLAPGLFHSWQPPLLLAAAFGGLCIVGGVVYAAIERRAQRRGGIDTSVTTDKLVPGDLVRFDRTYWYVVGLCVTFYAAVFPFRRFANIFFVDAHGASPEQAAFLNGLLPLTAMVATPVFGLIVDRIGRRALLMTLGSLLLVPAFLLMAHSGLPLGVPVAMLGLSFSLVPAILWPSVAYLVDEKRLGTAYALMTFCQQIGWAAMSWAVGRANDVSAASASNPGGYDPGMWMFAALGFLGLSFSALLWRAETRPGAHGLETIVVTRPSP